MSGRRRRQAEMDAEAYQATVSEDQWQSTVTDLAELQGWLVIHVRNMIGNHPGIPDLLMFRGERYVAAELKAPEGTVSGKQRLWHERFAAAGGTVRVWRPADWPEVEETLR